MLSVGRILEGAFGLIRERYVAVAIWIAVYFAGNIAMMLSVGSMFGVVTNPAAVGDPSAMISAMVPIYLISFIMLLVGLVLYAAAMRAVLRPDANSAGFLRLGMDELRLLGLLILFFIVGFMLVFVFSILAGLIGVGAAAGSQSSGVAFVAFSLVPLAVFIVMLFLTIRLSLAFPLTLHRGKLAIGEAWKLSRGRFWTLFGAALVVTLLVTILNMAVSLMTMGGYMFDIFAAVGDPNAASRVAEAQARTFGKFSPMMILYSLGSAITAGLWVTLAGGSIATAAKLLIADADEDAEDVFG